MTPSVSSGVPVPCGDIWTGYSVGVDGATYADNAGHAVRLVPFTSSKLFFLTQATVCEFDSNAALVIVPDVGRAALVRVLAGMLRVVTGAVGLLEAAFPASFVILVAALVAGRATDGPREGAAVLARTGGVERAAEGARVVARETGARTVDCDVVARVTG
jgi:hypothetical protein